jgi:hypothetical protein
MQPCSIPSQRPSCAENHPWVAMGQKTVHLRTDLSMRTEPCPQCQNREHFTARSSQCAEDACEVWVECACGFDPTAEAGLYRVEDVWGSLDVPNILTALDVWNERITAQRR